MSNYEAWLEAVCTGGGVIVNPPDPPVFTAQPSDQCIATPTDICHTCDGGTITGYRWRVNGGPWTNVT